VKIDKKGFIFAIISILLLVISSLPFPMVGPVFCTFWIIVVIINYGMKGGLLFSLVIGLAMLWDLHVGDHFNPELAVAGIFTYISMSLGIGLPIDMMRRAQASRIASEERLRRITDNIQDVIMQMDKNGIIQYISPSCLKVFGHTPDFYVGKSFYSELYPNDYYKVFKIVENALANKVVKPMEYRYNHKNGDFVWMESLGEVILDEKGEGMELVINCRDITERRATEERIKYLSFHDTLTGLNNRGYFEEKVKSFHYEKKLPLSIIIGDVNGLKLTNDVFGHYEGDNLLIKIANILRESCRRDDIIVRWGGDEFAILLPEADEEISMVIVNRIMDNCSKRFDEPIKISIALGAATKHEDSEDIKDIIKDAEEKMYRHKLLESRSVRNSIIASLEKTLFERSYETKEHAERMMQMSEKLGKEIGLAETEQDELRLLALLHDIGKIAVNDSILGKPGKLTKEEWEEMRKHTEIGYRIAESTQELYHIADYILSHHENWDGTGYPHGLKGDKIPKLSRILSIIDAYDVMTHARPYKAPISPEEAIEEIKRCAGTQFDPQLARIFIHMIEKDYRD
jgi:diguanylate cyclase (GGDEF)-like protein/PAS domain S-box-containing protein/putative nucleotidyltransferase with HDIG domain